MLDGPVLPDVQSPPAELAPPSQLPFQVEDWTARLTASADAMRQLVSEGRKNVDRYRMKPYAGTARTLGYVDEVFVPADFWNVESKRAQLWYRLPEGVLTGRTQQAELCAPLLQQILTDKISPDHLHLKARMDEVLFDVLCPMGFGALDFGHQTYNVTMDQPDPVTGEMTSVEVPAHQRDYVDRIPPGRMRFPYDFTGSDYDEADWLGFRFSEAAPDDQAATDRRSGKEDDDLLYTASASRATSKNVRWGHKVWYRACQFDPTCKDPNEVRGFELMDGDSQPRWHDVNPCAHMKGFPIKVLTIRYVSDMTIPPPDCTITRVLVDEVSKGRTQALIHRDRSLPQNLYDSTSGLFTPDVLSKIERSDINAFVGVPGPITETATKPLEKGELSRESFVFNDTISRDIERAWGLSANQSGQTTDTSRTATELQIIEQAKDTRIDYERDKITAWYCYKVLRTIAGLIKSYATKEDVIRFVSPQGAIEYKAWTAEQLADPDHFDYSIKINSQLRPDSAADLKRTIDWLNFSAKSPFINQAKNWEMAAKQFGFDPAVVMQQPPPPAPEQPSLSISIKGEDLNPMMPQYANVAALLEANGQKLPLPPRAAPNPITPGTADQADLMSKRQAGESGQLPGGGSQVANLTGAKVM